MFISFLKSLRHIYWKFKYKRGRTITFCSGYDSFSQIVVIENRLSSAGTLVYRERQLNTIAMGVEQEEFSPPREDPIQTIIKRHTTF